ncbi:MAG: trypsin-like peptidase domain-containing protein [Spirulina sp. SIO3F2]|nr:trypsin-like peptidase domain-containing protein [Spirulina sp. SIO3F2]
MGFEQFQQSIARLHNAHGAVVGAGFLVGDRYLMTCAHVVKKALGSYKDAQMLFSIAIQVDFPLITEDKSERTAQVIVWRPKSAIPSLIPSEDVAVLELNEPVPDYNDCDWVEITEPKGHTFSVCGFPKGSNEGIWVKGEFFGRQGQGLIQMEPLKEGSRDIEQGFSGSPVWDEDENAVVGIAVAVEKKKQDVIKAAFAIPTRTLKQIWQPCHALLIYLDPWRETFTKHWSQVYQRCLNLQGLKPQTVAGIVANLHEQGEKYLAEFVGLLWLDPETPEPLKRQLASWSKRAVGEEEFEQLCDRLRPKQKQTAAIPTVLVLVTPVADGSRYMIEAGYIHNVQHYNSQTGDGYEQLTAEFSEPLSRNELAARMPLILEDLLDQTCDYWGNLDVDVYPRIEFFLPIQLVDQDIERYCIGESREFPMIERDFPALVRLWDRLGYKCRKYEQTRLKKKWLKRWQYMQTCHHQNCIELLICGDRPSDIVWQDLNQETTIAVKITKELDGDRRKTISNLIRTGIPIALWLRKALADCNAQDTLQSLLLKRLVDLPHHLNNERKQAPCHDSEHLSHHLSLLWDDPKKIPPETRLISHKLS